MILQNAKGDQTVPNPAEVAVIRAGRLDGSTTFYRHDLALEELLAIYHNNQQADGRVGGFANWGVYTPSMLYAAAKHCLLSSERTGSRFSWTISRAEESTSTYSES